MKRTITQSLMLLMALVWAIPASAALKYEITVDTVPVAQKAWGYKNSSTNYVAKSIAVANGVVYTVKPGYVNDDNVATITYWNPVTGKSGNIATKYVESQVGWSIAADDKGNIIFQCGGDLSSRAKYFCVYKSSGEFGKNVSASGAKEYPVSTNYNSTYAGTGAAHYINATGDCYNGPGKIWICTYKGTVASLNISSGLASGSNTGLTKYTLNSPSLPSESETGSTESSFNPYADGKYLLYGRDMSVYDCTISDKVITATELVSKATHDNAADIEYLQGHKILVHNNGDYTDYRVVVKDLTKDKNLATLHTLPEGASTETSYRAKGVGSYSRFEKGQDDNTLYLYTFCSRRGFKKYEIKATATNAYTNPVASLTADVNIADDGTQQAVLTWTAPSSNASHVANYKIYRGDTEIAIVAKDVLTYTDTEALTAETTYKVIPVYDNEVTVGTDVTVTVAPLAYDPVATLTASRVLTLVEVNNINQQAVLTWTAPSANASHVTGYNVYRGDELIETVAGSVLTYTDAELLTASTTYKVEPVYNSSVGNSKTVTIAPITFAAPTGLALEQYDGYTRVLFTYSPCTKYSGMYARYDIIRDDAIIAKDLSQAEYIDTYVPEGEHTYTVEVVYYMPDADGKYTLEAVRLRSVETQSVTVKPINSTLVNYTLEEVYNYEMWDIWNADQANGKKLPANFNPDLMDGTKFVDAAHYRQGALVTDANGKKWWYIAQQSDATEYETTNGTSGGILKISAEGDVLAVGGNASMLSLPTPIKNGQSRGIATDENGNIFVRGWNQVFDDINDWAYNNSHNCNGKLLNGVIYSADLSKSFTVDFSGIDFDEEDVLADGNTSKERIDYYRVSGDLMGTSYLYVVAGCSRTYTKVKMVNDGTNITATVEEQYTPTTMDNGTVLKVSNADGYENYAFPIEETTAGSKGVVYQKRSVGYFYVPEGGGSNSDIYTTSGKIANAGGTTVKMTNAQITDAAQLFIITPQSFYSRNIGSFVVGLVHNNDFTHQITPIANVIQEATEHAQPDGTADNVNGNWLFAEWDLGDPDVTGDENMYIYQYVPGIRIAKYRMYGNIGFYDTKPTLEITPTLHEIEGDITHFTATATWSSPETYKGPGDYAIHHYKVELLDKNNHVIDCKEVPSTESLDANAYEPQNYTVTFCTTEDLSNSTDVEVGNESNHFVDDDCLYTVRVTTVYDLRQVMQGTTTAMSDRRESTVQTDQTSLSYTTEEPKGTVTIYKGTSGSVTNNYRIEIDIESPSLESAPVSYYELFITRKNIILDTEEVVTLSEDNLSYQEETEQITDFVLVTSDGITEGASNVPGSLVREGKNGQYRADSQYAYIAYNYDANYDKNNYTGKNYDPTTWTYSLNAVYADDNSLLRKTNVSTISLNPDFIETDVEEVFADGMNLNAYPIPADTELTVQSGQTIEQIIILSTSGAEVKRIDGNGEMKMTIDVEDLASGYYFLKVNNLPVMKIIVK